MQVQQSTREDQRRRLAYYSAATGGGSEGTPPTVSINHPLCYYVCLITFVDVTKQGRGRRGRRSGPASLPNLARVRTHVICYRDVCLMASCFCHLFADVQFWQS